MDDTQISQSNTNNNKWLRSVLIVTIVAVLVFVMGLLLVFSFGRAATGLSFFSDKFSEVAAGVSGVAGEVAEVADITTQGSFDAEQFARVQRQYVLRPEDLPVKYFISKNGETPYQNTEAIGTMRKIDGTNFVLATERVDGWEISMKRSSDRDIAPEMYKSTIHVFQDSNGAELALSPEWLPTLTSTMKDLGEAADHNCNVGAECILYVNDEFNQVSGISTMTYSLLFRYKNTVVTIWARGLEMEIDKADVVDAAKAVLSRLQDYKD